MTNRVSSINFQKNPKYNMSLLLANLTPPSIVPKANKYYTFVYKAKTPGITYDQYPLIMCGNVFRWGFTGLNVHWESIRQYSWAEVLSNLYELNDEEFQFLQEVPLANFKST